jgi:hypothetical protein
MVTFSAWKHTIFFIWIGLALLMPQVSHAAGGPRKLVDPHVEDMSITSDSQWVVYYADNALYSVPITGGRAIRLTGL